MRHLAWAAGIMAIVAMLGSRADADKARADKLFEDGRKYLAAKEYALACTAFEQSQQADPAIGTQLNIAHCYEGWGKLASAYRAYQEAEKQAKAKQDKRAKGARQKVDELGPKVPRIQLDIPADADAAMVLMLDGKMFDRGELELLLDPGAHEIDASVPGKPPVKTKIEAKVGQSKRVTIDIPKADSTPVVKPVTGSEPQPTVVTVGSRDKRKFYGGLALTAGGAIAIAVGGFVALSARQDYNQAIEGCPGQVCTRREDYDATQDARTRANIMTFVIGGGVGLAGFGVYWMLTSGKRAQPTESRTVMPVVSGNGLGLAIGGAW